MKAGWVSRYQAVVFCLLAGLALVYHYIPGGGAEKRWIYVVALALALPTIFQFSKSSALDRWIGELSYPLYIVHLLAFDIVSKAVGGTWLAPIKLATALLCAALIAVLVDHQIDPIRARLAMRRAAERTV
jgi:peptidoglycan/LPS O-acetylase OafA/YrhL